MTITVRFTGICTHLTTLGGGNGKRHRVVLVRADNGAYLNDAPIPPHIPKLRIDPKWIAGIENYPYGLEPMGQDGLWHIRGVGFGVKGAVGAAPVRDPSFENVPRLETDTGRPGPSDEVMFFEQAACYFDLTAGTIKVVPTGHDAIGTEASIETDDAPALHVTCFWNRAESWIHLKPGAVIDVEHTGYQQGDSDKDFLLHFRILQNVPRDAKIPKEPKSARNRAPGDISIGCSNSQYP